MSWKFQKEDFMAFPVNVMGWSKITEIANAKLKEWVEASPVVYGADPNLEDGAAFTLKPCNVDTHTARLICVEPIKKDTAEDLLREFSTLWDRSDDPDIEALLRRAKKLLDGK